MEEIAKSSIYIADNSKSQCNIELTCKNIDGCKIKDQDNDSVTDCFYQCPFQCFGGVGLPVISFVRHKGSIYPLKVAQ